MTNSTRLLSLKRRRALWLDVHLWLGLFLGIPLSIIGITGSISVFYQELDEWLNPDVLTVQTNPGQTTNYRPLDEVISAANVLALKGDERASLQYPRTQNSTFGVGYIRHRDIKKNLPETWVSVRVNPYTAKVTGIRSFPLDAGLPPGLVDFIAVLHYRFLLDDDWGGTVVGLIGLLAVFSALTGVILWWPITGNWHKAFSFKRTKNIKRICFDLHKLTGIFTLIILLPVLISGVYMNFNEKFVGLVQTLSPGTNLKPIIDFDHSEVNNISLSKATRIVDKGFPEGKLNWVADNTKEGVYLVSKKEVSSTSKFWAERIFTVESKTGKIVHIRDATTRKTAGETFLDWQWPLHSGKAFGWTGRILVFISGLAIPILFITGLIRYVQKRKAKSLIISCKSSRLIDSKLY